jgi:hypothetical protein
MHVILITMWHFLPWERLNTSVKQPRTTERSDRFARDHSVRVLHRICGEGGIDWDCEKLIPWGTKVAVTAYFKENMSRWQWIGMYMTDDELNQLTEDVIVAFTVEARPEPEQYKDDGSWWRKSRTAEWAGGKKWRKDF